METFANEIFEVAEIELSYKSKVKAKDRPVVHSSLDAYQILLQAWDENRLELQEQFKIMLLNRANKVLGVCEISTGGICSTTVDCRLIFATALKAAAVNLIISHNHPTSNKKPSAADISLTGRIKEIGNLLDIAVLDHIVVTTEGYYSFADEGLL